MDAPVMPYSTNVSPIKSIFTSDRKPSMGLQTYDPFYANRIRLIEL